MITDAHLNAVLEVWSQIGARTTNNLIGHSMSPLIRNDDTVVIEYTKGHLSPGDIVVFKNNHKFCAHRLIKIYTENKKSTYLFKGDNRPHFDPLIRDEQIIGKLVEASGSNGPLKFNSFSWKLTNYILSRLSYLSARCHAADSSFWHTLSRIFSFISRITLKGQTCWSTLLRGIAKAVRIKNRIQLSLGSKIKE